ncbi:NlpC/P60 family protein [Rhizobium sp. BK251]|uniref:C40 family peptidase n=1 Tax=Rhizobium sp. BK251 TaxID=2512125 RepID=UPI0010479D42|nr:NlpC/P60 family protein [Rhizobium sp. BK251]TCL76180.1 NlpC/P60 family putative phage cell wall peptidase [Rhizobium sp. BK251]
MNDIRQDVLAAAEGWIGTPYRHQGSTKGVGCDCLGLVRGVWREIYGHEPELPPPYAPDWAERGGRDRLMVAALRHFGPPIAIDEADAGDLLLFRWRPDHAAKHAGILCGQEHFIHAYEQAAVVRSALVPSWRRRIAGVFRFPARPEVPTIADGPV